MGYFTNRGILRNPKNVTQIKTTFLRALRTTRGKFALVLGFEGTAGYIEKALNELKHALLLPFFFAGQIIYDIGDLCRIAPPNFANIFDSILTKVQPDVRDG